MYGSTKSKCVIEHDKSRDCHCPAFTLKGRLLEENFQCNLDIFNICSHIIEYYVKVFLTPFMFDISLEIRFLKCSACSSEHQRNTLHDLISREHNLNIQCLKLCISHKKQVIYIVFIRFSLRHTVANGSQTMKDLIESDALFLNS
jgi:hypothetical protein